LSIIVLIGFAKCKTTEQTNTDQSNLIYVDPFIGTAGHGHVYPGAMGLVLWL